MHTNLAAPRSILAIEKQVYDWSLVVGGAAQATHIRHICFSCAAHERSAKFPMPPATTERPACECMRRGSDTGVGQWTKSSSADTSSTERTQCVTPCALEVGRERWQKAWLNVCLQCKSVDRSAKKRDEKARVHKMEAEYFGFFNTRTHTYT